MASSAIPADPEEGQSLLDQEGLRSSTRSQESGRGGFFLEFFRSGAGDGLHYLRSHFPLDLRLWCGHWSDEEDCDQRRAATKTVIRQIRALQYTEETLDRLRQQGKKKRDPKQSSSTICFPLKL